MKNCPSCQTSLAEDARTCPKCGQTFTTSSGVLLAILLGVIGGIIVLWLVLR